MNTTAPEDQIYEVYVDFTRDRENAQDVFLHVYSGGLQQVSRVFDAEPGQTYYYRAIVVAAGQDEPLTSEWGSFTMPEPNAKTLNVAETVDSRFNQEVTSRNYAFTAAAAGCYEISLDTDYGVYADVVFRIMQNENWQIRRSAYDPDEKLALIWQLDQGQTLYMTLIPNEWSGMNHDYQITVNEVTPVAAFTAPTLTYKALNDFSGSASLTAEVPLGAEYSMAFWYRRKGEEGWSRSFVDGQEGVAAGSCRTAEGTAQLNTTPGVSYEIKGVLTDLTNGEEFSSQIMTVTAPDGISTPLSLTETTVLTADMSSKYAKHYYSFTAEDEGFYEFTLTYLDYPARLSAGSFAIFDSYYSYFTGYSQLTSGSATFRQHLQAGERTFLQLTPEYTQDYTLSVTKLNESVLKLTAPTVTADFTTDPYQADYTVYLSADVPLGSWFELGLQTKNMNNGAMEDRFLTGRYDYLYETISQKTSRSLQPGETYQYRAYLYDWRTGQRYYSDWAEFTAPEVKELSVDQVSWYRVNDQLRNKNRFYRFEAAEDGFYRVLLTGKGYVYSRYMNGAWSSMAEGGELLKLQTGEVIYYRIRANGKDDYQLSVTKVEPTVTGFQNLTLGAEVLAPDQVTLDMTAEVPLWSNYRAGFEYTLEDSGETRLAFVNTVYNNPAEQISYKTTLSVLYGLWQHRTYSVRSFVFDLNTGKTWYSDAQTIALDPDTKVVTLELGVDAEGRVLQYTGTEGTETDEGLARPENWRPTYFLFTAPESGLYDVSSTLTSGNLTQWYGDNSWGSVPNGRYRAYLLKDQELYMRFMPSSSTNWRYNSSYQIRIDRCESEAEAAKPELTLNKCTDYTASFSVAAAVPLESRYELFVTYKGDFWRAEEESRVIYLSGSSISVEEQIERSFDLVLLPGKTYTIQATLTITGDDGKETVLQSDAMKITTPDNVTRTLPPDQEMRTVYGADTQYDRYRFVAEADGTYCLTVSGEDSLISICANRYGEFTDTLSAGKATAPEYSAIYWFNLKKGQEVYLRAITTPETGSMLRMVKVPEIGRAHV